MFYSDNILFVYIIIMYMNQMIISFVLFAFLVFVTTLPKEDKNREHFYSTQNFTNPNYTSNMQYDKAALYYHPNSPYPQQRQGPLPQNNCKENISDKTIYDDVYSPRVAKNDSNAVKCMFCLLLIGMLYTGYTYGYFNMTKSSSNNSSSSTASSSR